MIKLASYSYRFIKNFLKLFLEDKTFYKFLIFQIIFLLFGLPYGDLDIKELEYKKNNKWLYRMEDEDFELLKTCRRVAFILGYDENEIDEAYYTKRLLFNELSRQKSISNYDLIIINRKIQKENNIYQLANIIHEVIHVYTDSISEWREEMKKAIKYFPECEYYLERDIEYDHLYEIDDNKRYTKYYLNYRDSFVNKLG